MTTEIYRRQLSAFHPTPSSLWSPSTLERKSDLRLKVITPYMKAPRARLLLVRRRSRGARPKPACERRRRIEAAFAKLIKNQQLPRFPVFSQRHGNALASALVSIWPEEMADLAILLI